MSTVLMEQVCFWWQTMTEGDGKVTKIALLRTRPHDAGGHSIERQIAGSHTIIIHVPVKQHGTSLLAGDLSILCSH